MASGSQTIDKGSDEIFTYECDVCKHLGKTSEAISFCTVCTEYLCKTCDQVHRGSKLSRDHQIVTVSHMTSSSYVSKPVLPIMLCEHHKTMTLNVYCVNHDYAICGTCKLTDHRKCQTTDVTQQTKGLNVEKAFDGTVKGIKDLKRKYEHLMESGPGDKGRLKSEINRCLEDVRKLRCRINGVLDGLEQKLTQEASNIEDSMTEDINNHVTIAHDALNQIDDQIKSLGECRKYRDNDVMFVGMKKADVIRNKYGDIISNIVQEMYPIQIEFKPNAVITDVLMQLESLGTLQTKKTGSHKASTMTTQTQPGPSSSNRSHVSLLNMTASNRREIGVGSRRVFDCTFIGGSHLVLACGDGGLKLLDKHFNVQSRLRVEAYRVAAINNHEVVITQEQKQIQRVSIFPTMSVIKTVKMNKDCYGVDVYNNEIYVTCHDYPGNGEVRVLTMDGKLLKQFGLVNGEYMFRAPSFIKVSRNGSMIFVSDSGTNKVTCLSDQGRVLYEYTDGRLRFPAGLYVDGDGNVLVCGKHSHNVHIINRDGTKHKVMLSERDGVEDPMSLSYRPGDGCLVVGLGGYGGKYMSLITFTTNSV